MRGAVLDEISHRLRTPLNTIFGFGQLIADSRFGDLTDAQRGYAESILESDRHMLATIDDVTKLAALEIDSLQGQGENLSLGDTLMLTGRLLERRAVEEGVALRFVAPESGCNVACDAGRLRQIIFNMSTDAINCCCNGGTEELHVRAGPDNTIEIYTLEHQSPGGSRNKDSTGAASLSLPFIRRLVTREGGSFELCEDASAKTFSAICRLPALGDPSPAEPS